MSRIDFIEGLYKLGNTLLDTSLKLNSEEKVKFFKDKRKLINRMLLQLEKISMKDVKDE